MSTEFVTAADRDLETAKRDSIRICEREGCGRRFVPGKSWQRFCTPRCRGIAHKAGKDVASAESAAEQIRSQRQGGEWGAISRYPGGPPRPCACNGGHRLYVDDDGDYACHACGGQIEGPTIYAFIDREKKAGRAYAEIAEQLRMRGAPLALDGFDKKVGWNALAVLKVLVDGSYLSRNREKAQRGNAKASSARWTSSSEALDILAIDQGKAVGRLPSPGGNRGGRPKRSEPDTMRTRCLNGPRPPIDPSVREYIVSPPDSPLTLPAPRSQESRIDQGTSHGRLVCKWEESEA